MIHPIRIDSYAGEKMVKKYSNTDLVVNLSEIDDWNHVDYVCLKSKSGTLTSAVYYLDGHTSFESSLTNSDLEYISFARENECYGTSEIILDGEPDKDRFYIRVNVSTKDQEQKLIQFLMSKIPHTLEQKRLLDYCSGIEFPVNCQGDYKPLYYCGFSKNRMSSQYYGTRFYYKTFGVDEQIRYDVECIHYLEKNDIFRSDSAFCVAKKLIEDRKVGLRCIGIEFSSSFSVKLKYYLCQIENGLSAKEILQEITNFPCYQDEAESLIPILDDMKDFQCDWIQMSSGFYDGDESINMYIGKQDNRNKQYYSLREGLVLRNIGGINFLIDIHEKHYYDLKNLFSVNETGQAIIQYFEKHGVSTIDGVVSHLRSLIINYTEDLYPIIYSDCKAFVEQLLLNEYLLEVK